MKRRWSERITYLHILRCSSDATFFAAFLCDAPARCNSQRTRARAHNNTRSTWSCCWFTVCDKARLLQIFVAIVAIRTRAPNKYPTLTMLYPIIIIRETPLQPIRKVLPMFFFFTPSIERRKHISRSSTRTLFLLRCGFCLSSGCNRNFNMHYINVTSFLLLCGRNEIAAALSNAIWAFFHVLVVPL